MKKIILFLFFNCILFFNSYNQTIISGGNLSGILKKSNSPYRIVGDVTIPDDSILTIEPGVVVRVDSAKRVTIQGSLKAIGTITDRIKFSSVDTNQSSYITTKGWYGLVFSGGGQTNNNDSSILKYCTIEHSKYSNIYVTSFNRLKIDKSIIRKGYGINGGGIWIYQSSIILSNSIIIDNYSEVGAGILLYNSNSFLLNNIISNNRTSRVGGGIYITANSNSIFTNNIICNNSAFYNLGSSGGAALYISDSKPIFYNNTITYNNTGSNGGGVFLTSNADPSFYNCIIYNNVASEGNQLFIDDYYSDPNFYYCDIQGGKAGFSLNSGITYDGVYLNNIDVNPQFLLIPGGSGASFYGANWSLNSTSGLVNKGDLEGDSYLSETDCLGKKRISYGIVDIGAIEFSRTSISVSANISANTTWFADTVKVYDTITVNDNYKLTIMPGVVVCFYGPYLLNIEGTIEAIGTSRDRIKFTYFDIKKFAKDRLLDTYDAWKGIRFRNPSDGRMFDNDTSKLIYCLIEYVKTMGNKTIDGAINVNNFPKVIIENSIIAHNTGRFSAGVHLSAFADIIFSSNEVYDNQTYLLQDFYSKGAGLYISNSDPLIFNNKFYQNTSCVNGSALFINRSNGKFYNNIISNNYSTKDGGAVYIEECDLIWFYNNLIINNETQLGTGGGIFIQGNINYFFNNTIAYNKSGGQGGGICFNGDKNNCFNTIVYNNMPNQIYLGSYSNNLGIYNSNIQNDSTSFSYFKQRKYYTIIYQNNINKSPAFSKPSSISGVSFNGLLSDFSILNISPCINAGTNNIGNIKIPTTDYINNARIHSSSIDIGAYENQGNVVTIITQPVNRIKCEKDTAIFSVQVSDTAIFQWQKDGKNIIGATSKILTIPTVLLSNEGDYSCIVSNSYGTTITNNVYLLIKSKPILLSQLATNWIGSDKTATLSVSVDGSSPLTFEWYKKDTLINGATKPYFKISNVTKKDESIYICKISNTCGTITSKPDTITMHPQICMVTVDTATGNNLIIWGKESSRKFKSYNIYRESSVAGVYSKIGSIPYNSISIFEDTTSNPKSQAFIYKITALDSSDVESDINACAPHKTIHLLVTKGIPSGYQLDWDEYIGFNYGTYNIYRSTNGKDFSLVHQMASSTKTWTDYNTPDGLLYYVVAVEKLNGCFPSLNKASSGPFSQSISNLEDNRLKENSIDEIQKNNIKLTISPNPCNEQCRLEFYISELGNMKISVIDILGNIIINNNKMNLPVGNYTELLNVKDLSSGIYYIRFEFNNKVIIKSLIKE